MQKPFLKLREYLGTPLNILKSEKNYFSEKPFKGEEKDWSEIVYTSKPLKEKNFYWKFSPKKAFWNFKKEWPPEKIEIKIWLTPEYIEGRKSIVSKRIIKALREGRFAIKKTLNLRGMFIEEAKEAFEEFMKSAILNGDRCILIIHGRGLSSKQEPVLKNKVKEWLERGDHLENIYWHTVQQDPVMVV